MTKNVNRPGNKQGFYCSLLSRVTGLMKKSLLGSLGLSFFVEEKRTRILILRLKRSSYRYSKYTLNFI